MNIFILNLYTELVLSMRLKKSKNGTPWSPLKSSNLAAFFKLMLNCRIEKCFLGGQQWFRIFFICYNSFSLETMIHEIIANLSSRLYCLNFGCERKELEDRLGFLTVNYTTWGETSKFPTLHSSFSDCAIVLKQILTR